MKSSIFLSDISVVDHAYINDQGQVIGGSFNPGFIVSGEVDPVEKVVVDFSTIKKDVKQSIDKHIDDYHHNGFDHKIWFIEGYSGGTYRQFEDKIEFKTPAFKARVPLDAVRIISNVWQTPEYSIEFIGEALRKHVLKDLQLKYPLINVDVECYNNTNVHVIEKHWPIAMFTYSHGLKDSTSYGCQNLLHGHLSYIQHESDINKLKIISEELNNAVFIFRENIMSETDDEISIQYRTEQRGLFSATYYKNLNKIIVLDTETTIEYIAEYVRQKYDVSNFYISEGLSKGTVVK